MWCDLATFLWLAQPAGIDRAYYCYVEGSVAVEWCVWYVGRVSDTAHSTISHGSTNHTQAPSAVGHV